MLTRVSGLPSLSIVVPVYNEPDWIGRSTQATARAVEAAGLEDVEMVIVDDGSGAPTQAALAALELPFPLRVLRQENAGRFAARRHGISEARGELVLMIDARVMMDPQALAFIAEHWHPDRAVWNGHVDIEMTGNPYARFWDTLTQAAFAEYFGDPRTTSFGLEEYDRFPKGTTQFLAPREWLLEIIDGFSSHYADLRHANDDTVMLRTLAGRQRINISPGFRSTYHSRTNLRGFLKHSFHRGTVFFDGFSGSDNRFRGVLFALFPASLAGLVIAARRPRLGLAGLAAVPIAAATLAATRWKRPWRHVLAFAGLSPAFGVTYVAGIWRGAALALRDRRSK
jgi:glycosyltransferase involved in cell wall biosynthesis